MMVLIFLMIWVVPLFSGLFQDMGESLPWLTQAVIEVAKGFQENFFLLLSLFGCLVMGVRWMFKDPKSRHVIDGLVLRTPLFGDVFRKAAIVRFSRTLGFLIHRGVPLLTALNVAGTVTGNKVLEQSITRSTTAVQDGTPLSETLRASKVFPPMVTQMIKVGESTGFPAPFSPRSPRISPDSTVMSTESLAMTPGNRFVTLRSSSFKADSPES
jgi:type IV pilus assembly protein PilC